jgi:hypothetical protein
MKSFLLAVLFAVVGSPAFADMLCGEATYTCVDPENAQQALIVNKKAVRFCTINEGLSRDEILAKLNYYEMCTALGGIVDIGSRNK